MTEIQYIILVRFHCINQCITLTKCVEWSNILSNTIQWNWWCTNWKMLFHICILWMDSTTIFVCHMIVLIIINILCSHHIQIVYCREYSGHFMEMFDHIDTDMCFLRFIPFEVNGCFFLHVCNNTAISCHTTKVRRNHNLFTDDWVRDLNNASASIELWSNTLDSHIAITNHRVGYVQFGNRYFKIQNLWSIQFVNCECNVSSISPSDFKTETLFINTDIPVIGHITIRTTNDREFQYRRHFIR